MKESVYSIKDLEVLSGIKAHTIRIWEKRYSLLNPGRTRTNIRRYCDRDLQKILNVAMLVKNGFRISCISGWREERIKKEIFLLNKVSKSSSHFIERLIWSTIDYDEKQIHSIVEEAIKFYGLEDAVTGIIFPFLERIGIYWQVGSLCPAQEHYFSNLIRQKIIVETNRLTASGARRDETILFYLHEDERHELSLLFFQMIALSGGYKVIYLGQNVPMKDLINLQQKKKIDMVFTVFLNSIEKENLEQYLVRLSGIFSDARVFVSGRMVSQLNPDMPRGVTSVFSVRDYKRCLGI